MVAFAASVCCKYLFAAAATFDVGFAEDSEAMERLEPDLDSEAAMERLEPEPDSEAAMEILEPDLDLIKDGSLGGR